jgi:hypothetical protein
MAKAWPHGVWIALAIVLTVGTLAALVALGVVWMLSYSD